MCVFTRQGAVKLHFWEMWDLVFLVLDPYLRLKVKIYFDCFFTLLFSHKPNFVKVSEVLE